MTHPHILNKSFQQITETTRNVLARVYAQPSLSKEDAQVAFDRARGVMDLWAELTFDMGVSEHINAATHEEFDQFVQKHDTTELARWDLQPRQR